MRLLLALLLGNAAANPLISLASKAKALVNFKNAAGATLVAPVLGGLNSLREAASDAEDKRQGVKEEDPEGEACPPWTKESFKTKKPRTVCQPEATGTCKNNQGKGKVIKGVAVAVAAAALGVVLLPFK